MYKINNWLLTSWCNLFYLVFYFIPMFFLYYLFTLDITILG